MRADGTRRKLHLSLAWRTLFVPSAVLTVLFIIGSVLQERALHDNFEVRRERERDLSISDFHRIVGESSARLLDIAEWIPSLQDVSAAIAARDPEALTEAIERHWPTLEFQQGLVTIEIFDGQGQQIARQGRSIDAPDWDMQRNGLLIDTLALEQPVHQILCRVDCLDIVLAPLPLDRADIGAILIARPLSESLVEFRNLLSSDVSLLTPAEAGTAEVLDGYQLIPLVISIPDGPSPFAVSRALRTRVDEWTPTAEPIRLTLTSRSYELYLAPLLSDHAGPSREHVLLVDDISDQVAEKRQIIANSRVMAIGGIALTLLTVLAMLWRPTRRLRDATRILPAITTAQYDRARTALADMQRHSWTADEVDDLTTALLSMSDQLEELHHELDVKLIELGAERDFAESLLDTVEVVILTLDGEGRIVSANRHAHGLIGLGDAELRGRPLASLLLEPTEQDALTGTLAVISTQVTGSFHQQATLVTADQQSRHILWAHSRIRGHAIDGSVILSAGLDVTAHKAAQARMSWLNDHDALTGLFNRRRSEQELEQAIQEARQQRREGVLILLDVDNFKDINDTAGHEVGDLLLRDIASAVTEFTERLSNTGQTILGRLGADEFVLLLRDTGKVDAMYIAERLLLELNDLTLPFPGARHGIMVSASVTLFPHHGRHAHELLSHADMAMAKAKSRGGGQWHLFSPREDMRAHIADRVMWRERIEQALNHERFELHFQPMLAIAENSIHHYEVLLRMLDDNDVLVPPDKFIPVAERNGLIARIDLYVIEHALSRMMEMAAKDPNITLAINLSARAFENDVLTDVLAATIQRYRIDPRKLIFELTETAAIADTVNTRRLMSRLRDIGCLFALDDFGVGFTSFHYLTELPVDIVKIDGSFIREIDRNPTSRLIVEALIQITKSLGIATVAEFVESAAILSTLRTLGVDMAQGFHIGRPAPNLLLDGPVPA